MKTRIIAIPLANGRLTAHFGHCASFALVKTDEETKEILGKEELIPPPHEPGVLPRWLGEKGANIIIAGGMGGSARAIFSQQGIEVITGAPCLEPEELVTQYLHGTLTTGENACDH